MKNALGVALGLLAGLAINIELGLLSTASTGTWRSEDASPVLALAAIGLLLIEAAGCCFLLLRRAPDTATVARRGCVLGLLLSVAMFPLLAFAKSAVKEAAQQKSDMLDVFAAYRDYDAFALMASRFMVVSALVLVLCVAVLAVMYLSRRDHLSVSPRKVDGPGARTV